MTGHENPSAAKGKAPNGELLAAGPVQSEWHWTDSEDIDLDSVEATLGWVNVTLPDPSIDSLITGFSGDMVLDYWGDKVMKAGTVSIPEELEGHHLGEKLTRALGYEAVKKGCDEIEVDFLHPASLKAFIKVFGFERLHPFSRHTLNELPKTEEELLQRVTYNWGYPKHGGRPRRLRDVASTEATVDLRGLDVSQWEVPVELGDAEDRYPNVAIALSVEGGAASVSDKTAGHFFKTAIDGGHKAIILIGTPNGTIPTLLNTHIAETVKQGIPVVVLSSNYAYDTGPQVDPDAPYELLVDAAEAGATLLRDVNVNGIRKVVNTINVAAALGKQGSELNQVIIDRFGVPEGLDPSTVEK